jgi:tRNA A-37 threonylcarbamoyl transferase component Bud32
MPDAKLIGRPLKDTPSGQKSTTGGRRLPPDLLRQASARLATLALVAMVLWVVATVLWHLAFHATNPGDPRWAQVLPTDIIALGGAVMSFGLFLYIRRGHHDPEFVMDLGLVYLVITAAIIGVLMHWGDVREHIEVSPMITWIGPVILMGAAIVPTQPWKLLIAGLLAASMDPLGMVIAKAAGLIDYGPFSNTLVMHYPNYLMVGVAVVISRVVTRLGQQVSKERELGSYRLGELLGRGGMGEVYKATHRMLARPAAIKLIQPEVLAGHDRASVQLAVARFRREAEAAARLRSPHTVELYDFGLTEDGTLYFVMELLEGMDLESLVRQEGPLPQKRVIHILRQVCESLEEAHVSGLVHRDIKPANIHVGRLGLRHDFVKVLDFGLVKSVNSVAGEDSMATAAGLTPGTPAYMAPEMALGEAVDGRADLYALGCVAYYLLTGKLVFEAASGFQMIAKHIQEAPVAPSRRSELEVGSDLDRVVLACLEKRPADRPQSAAELDRLLSAIQMEPWSEEDATQWWRQHQPA